MNNFEKRAMINVEKKFRKETHAKISVWQCISRGILKKCPNCGQDKLYKSYLKAQKNCPKCGTSLGAIKTDDFAPWITIVILGHILIPAGLLLERTLSPPLWVHFSIWFPTTFLGTLLILPMAKGGILALMWHLGLKGDENQSF